MTQSGTTERAAARRAALLEGAAELFFEQGYAATSIDAIIERVGGSKRNVYSEFGNKEGLFTALVTHTAAKVLSPLTVNGDTRDLRGTLLAFAERIIGLYQSPALVGIYRSAIAEGARFPDLARQFFEQGPLRASTGLADVLRAAQGRGALRDVDAQAAADLFVAMMRDNVHLQVVLGLRPPLGPEEIRKAAETSVDVFLRGVEVREPRGA